jgi:hypothetical protein
MKTAQLDIRFTDLDFRRAELLEDVPIDHYFPEDEANDLAKLESYNIHLFRPNSYLHKWWARRSGTTFRYILKQLVPDRYRRDYYTPGGLEEIALCPRRFLEQNIVFRDIANRHFSTCNYVLVFS